MEPVQPPRIDSADKWDRLDQLIVYHEMPSASEMSPQQHAGERACGVRLAPRPRYVVWTECRSTGAYAPARRASRRGS